MKSKYTIFLALDFVNNDCIYCLRGATYTWLAKPGPPLPHNVSVEILWFEFCVFTPVVPNFFYEKHESIFSYSATAAELLIYWLNILIYRYVAV